MPDHPITISLKAKATDTGFSIVAINAGVAKGHGIEFTPASLQASLSLWDSVPCMLDHPGFFEGPSVRDLAGALHDPKWSDTDQGIQANLIPGGPAAAVLSQLREAAKADPAIMSTVGFSAVLRVTTRPDGKVERILNVSSVDCVLNPARGGRFLSAAQPVGARQRRAQSPNQGVNPMNDQDTVSGLPSSAGSDDTEATITLLDAQKKVESTKKTADESLRQLRLQTCRTLLQVSLEASKLPKPIQDRIDHKFGHMVELGQPFEPNELESAISEEQEMVSKLTAAGAIQGPGRISNMVTTNDAIEAAVSDLFGVEREARLKAVKAARLTGIRELYLMLTGDYDLHGGYYGERIQLATTADFTGLVKNALNKIIANQWDLLGKAGYDWWQKIVQVQHASSLNDITGILVGTVGSLPTVAEGGEYAELAIGDSPETASFVKYGGYIPLTLELIDRDNVSRLTGYAKELGNASLRKYSALIAAVFTANSAVGPTMADTGALFNATAVTTKGGHANLLTTALGTDLTAWRAVELAMFNQPMLIKNASGYYGTGPVQGVRPRYCLVPPALKGASDDLFLRSWTSSGNNMAYGYVEPIVVPDWSDATDWAAVADPAIAPAIIVGERFGLQPEVYTAGSETDPAVFMNDETRIKVRMFAAILVQDFRPLHKENVAG